MKGAMSVKSPSRSIGEAPFTASSVPKSALHARKMPWPMTTPGFPVRRPYISAMIEPTCSWLPRPVWAPRAQGEDQLEARLLEDPNDGVGDVDLVWKHGILRRVFTARAGRTPGA